MLTKIGNDLCFEFIKTAKIPGFTKYVQRKYNRLHFINVPRKRIPDIPNVVGTKQALHSMKQFAGKDLLNDVENITAQVNKQQRGKIVSEKASYPSEQHGFTREQHLGLASKMDDVWRNAVFIGKATDKYGDPNIFMERFASPARVSNKDAIAYLSAKTGLQGRKLYDAWLLGNADFKRWIKEKNEYLGLRGGIPISYNDFLKKISK